MYVLCVKLPNTEATAKRMLCVCYCTPIFGLFWESTLDFFFQQLRTAAAKAATDCVPLSCAKAEVERRRTKSALEHFSWQTPTTFFKTLSSGIEREKKGPLITEMMLSSKENKCPVLRIFFFPSTEILSPTEHTWAQWVASILNKAEKKCWKCISGQDYASSTLLLTKI